MRCEAVEAQLGGIVDDPPTVGVARARHVAGCLRCQADLVHYRRIRRVMTAMRTEHLAVSSDMVAGVLRRLDESVEGQARHRRTGRRAACIGGLAAVTAAGVGSAVVLVARRRPV